MNKDKKMLFEAMHKVGGMPLNENIIGMDTALYKNASPEDKKTIIHIVETMTPVGEGPVDDFNALDNFFEHFLKLDSHTSELYANTIYDVMKIIREGGSLPSGEFPEQ